MSKEVIVPKDYKTITQSTRFETWRNSIAFILSGAGALFGIQKLPIANESTRISEAVQVVKNLSPEEITALQGVQVASLEKQVQANASTQIAAITELKYEMRSLLKDYDERTTKRLDKHGELILNNIKAIAAIEALVPKARASK